MVDDVEAPLACRARRPGRRRHRGRFARRACRSYPARAARRRAPTGARTPLAVFFAATATILLIGCVNLANLMFARGAARVGEIAVRASLGAARRRLVALLSVEALLLAGFAALASLPVALGVLRAIDALQPPGLNARGVELDPRAVAAAFAIAVLATLVFALLPISKLVATDPVRALQGSSARAFGGKNLGRFRFALATSQIALSMLLLVLAALFTQSLANIARVDSGLRTESIVTFRLMPNLNGYPRERAARRCSRRSSASSRREPGVTHVSLLRGAVARRSRVGHQCRRRGFRAAQPRESMRQRQSDRARVSSRRSTSRCSRAAISRTPTRSIGRSSRSSTRASRSASGSATTPSASGSGSSIPRPLDIEIVGLVRDAAYDSVKGEFPAQLMLPRAAGTARVPGRAHVLRARRAAARSDCSPPCRASSRASTRVCPSSRRARFDSVVRRNVRTDWLLVTLSGHARGRRDVARGARPLRCSLLYGRATYARDRPQARARRASRTACGAWS